MDDNNKDREAVYEIGYLIVGSIAEENVSAEADKVRKVITDAGAKVIGEEIPNHQHLAYTIRRKTVAGSYEKYDKAYFGWIKFEIGTDKIEAIKKTIEIIPSILRMLLITTVRENTYLGKRAPTANAVSVPTLDEKSIAREFYKAPTELATPEIAVENVVAPATVEEMDKSIDEMVKEA
ncbi:MAG: 30S ribosomal protein S6 [Candidatus Paceibacterota bacterium]|jgi:ribosomal protein S6